MKTIILSLFLFVLLENIQAQDFYNCEIKLSEQFDNGKVYYMDQTNKKTIRKIRGERIYAWNGDVKRRVQYEYRKSGDKQPFIEIYIPEGAQDIAYKPFCDVKFDSNWCTIIAFDEIAVVFKREYFKGEEAYYDIKCVISSYKNALKKYSRKKNIKALEQLYQSETYKKFIKKIDRT